MAEKSKTWVVETADGQHTVEFFPKTAFKPPRLFIDGEQTALDIARANFEGIDQPILTGGGHDIRLVSTRKNTDIAYDGVYMESGNAYEPLPKMSKANWVFVIVSLAAAILGGAVPAACAFGGAAAGSGVALSKKLSDKKKLILGVVIMVLTWALAIGLSIAAGKGINAAKKVIPGSFGKDEYKIELTQSFRADNDTGDLAAEAWDVIFAAASEDVYAYATKATFKKLKLLYGIEWTEPTEYLVNMLDVKSSDVKTTGSGVSYVVLNEEEYSYVCSVIAKNDAFYYTELYCTADDAEKLVPRLIEWTNGIKVTEVEQAGNAS